MSVGTHLACAKCKRKPLRSIRGRHGSPVKTPFGSIRLMSCKWCGLRSMVAAVVVERKNAEVVEHLLGLD